MPLRRSWHHSNIIGSFQSFLAPFSRSWHRSVVLGAVQTFAPFRRSWHRSDVVSAVEPVDDALPEFLLAVLGPAQALDHLVELDHAARGHAERVARAAHDVDKFIVVARQDVVDARVRALHEPAPWCTTVQIYRGLHGCARECIAWTCTAMDNRADI